jgi:hypothetical protein
MRFSKAVVIEVQVVIHQKPTSLRTSTPEVTAIIVRDRGVSAGNVPWGTVWAGGSKNGTVHVHANSDRNISHVALHVRMSQCVTGLCLSLFHVPSPRPQWLSGC